MTRDKAIDAIKSGKSLNGANLRGADLYCADLSGADLRGADLYCADLRGANLRGADLYSANLSGADLHSANLRGADLHSANLSGANLYGADLRGANLYGAKEIPAYVLSITMVPPESGQFDAWKKCRDGVLVRLRVPATAKRSSSMGRKCRAERVKVLEVIGGEVGISMHDGQTEYRTGKVVKCDKWDENRWEECGGGIHFFMTRHEAEIYGC